MSSGIFRDSTRNQRYSLAFFTGTFLKALCSIHYPISLYLQASERASKQASEQASKQASKQNLFVKAGWVHGQLHSWFGPPALRLVLSKLPLNTDLPTPERCAAEMAVGLWFVMSAKGFEPTRVDPIRFETLHFNHSATPSC